MSDPKLPKPTGVDKLSERERKKLFGKIIRKCVLSKEVRPHVATKCCECTGANVGGYAIIGLLNRSVRAHRVVYELRIGPAGLLDVLHRCDNPPCCNPEHLFLGTHRDNLDDMIRKGRQQSGERNGSKTHPERTPRGERHPHAKLTEEGVRRIFSLRSNGLTQKEIADDLKVSEDAVREALKGITWSHLGMPPEPKIIKKTKHTEELLGLIWSLLDKKTPRDSIPELLGVTKSMIRVAVGIRNRRKRNANASLKPTE